jgi:hypothetical protein
MKTALLLTLGLVAIAIIFTANEPEDTAHEEVLARMKHGDTHVAYAN